MDRTGIKDRILELRRVRASDLKPSPYNWRTHPKAQQAALRGSLKQLGYYDALVARRCEDGTLELIDGHLRAEVSPDEEVPVLVTDLSEAEAKAALLTHDPLAALAGQDDDLLTALAQDVTLDDVDLLKMVNGMLPKDKLRGRQDEEPRFPVEPITKPGDLWLLGEHRVLCGDATSEDDVVRLIAGKAPNLMVTDPPWGVNYDPEWREKHDKYVGRRRGKVPNDDRIDWREAYALFPGDIVYAWHAGIYANVTHEALGASGFIVRSQIIWAKQHFVLSRGAYHQQHEPCWYAVRKGANACWTGDRKQVSVWEIQNHNAMGGKQDDMDSPHGTQKPVECMYRPIANHGQQGDYVYDPFLGSGTTLIAAQQLGRRCLGIEIYPLYCDVIVQRWENFTGEKAVRHADG